MFCCRKRVPEADASGPDEATQGGKQPHVQTTGQHKQAQDAGALPGQAEDASLGNGAGDLTFKALAHHKWVTCIHQHC